MKKPRVADCLDEIRRLRAENDRLKRAVQHQNPTSEQLLPIATALRDLAFWCEMKVSDIGELRDLAYRLVGNDHLPTMEELGGCLSNGAARVDAAVGERQSVAAVDPHVPK